MITRTPTGWLPFAALLLLLCAAPPLAAEEDGGWRSECQADLAAETDVCRLAKYLEQGERRATLVFSYDGRSLNFRIASKGDFSYAEIDIDRHLTYFTQLCGDGYCLFEGTLAEQLARHFRIGRAADIQVATVAAEVVLESHVDLTGFDKAFMRFENTRRK